MSYTGRWRTYLGLVLVLVVSLCFSVTAKAGSTADPCADTTASCQATCPSGPACVVHLNRTSTDSVDIDVNGTKVDIFCVAKGVDVQWITPEANSFFGLTFSPTHSPFSKSILVGTSAKTLTAKAASHGQPCYVYSVVVCQGAKCGKKDPKVVIAP
jgi:hypothetical protein